ncbi:MAG: succinylglutamate desuccinylase/aspartoacylase family protein, partial [Burkholderia sp.]|nr:succinylglutamate desuccinylase/aspartoacylase family protein [Burkholderia sp.]
MQIRTTPLLSPSIGTQRSLTSFHFGPADAGRKIYLQAALHADETPAMLAAFVLKQRLAQLDADGRLTAEIVLVPVSNPVGLNHHLLGQFIGRFDLASGRNFNRGFLPLAEIAARARDRLGDDGERNREIVRECVGAALDAIEPRTEFDALQLALLKLSYDADVVIDLHCSLEAVMHVYTSDTAWPDIEPLARYLGAEVSLLAEDSGGHAFDDA